MPRKKMTKKPGKADQPEARVRRDSKDIGVAVMAAGVETHFPLGYMWRWSHVLGDKMLEVLDRDKRVISQFASPFVESVQGPACVQPKWRTPEYPS